MLKALYKPEVTCVISVLDLDKALAWYAEVLDFELKYKLDDIRWAEMQSCLTGLTIGLQELEALNLSEDTTLVFSVTDIAQAKAMMADKGVQTGEIREVAGMVKLMMFHDPFGNAFMLAQDL